MLVKKFPLNATPWTEAWIVMNTSPNLGAAVSHPAQKMDKRRGGGRLEFLVNK